MAGPDCGLDKYSMSLNSTFPSFCPNTFGCRAAKNPRLTQTEMSLKICRSCNEAPLLPSALLDDLIVRCPLCALLIGDSESLEKLGANIMDDKRCRICSTFPRQVWHWGKRGKAHAEVEKVLAGFSFPPENSPVYFLPELNFNTALAIMRAIISTHHGALAFQNLISSRDFDLDTLDKDKFRSLLCLFTPGSKVFEILEQRIEELNNSMPESLRSV